MVIVIFRGFFTSMEHCCTIDRLLTSPRQDPVTFNRFITCLCLGKTKIIVNSVCVCVCGRCKAPLKLQGQALETLQPDELGCRKELVGVKAMIAMSLTSLALAIMGLVVWQRKRRMPCRCLRGTSGRYISVYTREKRVTDDPEDSSCGDGEVDDLDLGNGAGPRSEGGKVMILLKSFTNNGYKRLKMNDSESSQDLTLSSTKGE